VETRRDALKIIGAIGATCSFPFSANELYAQHVHQAEGHPAAQPWSGPKFFTQDQFAVISRLSDLIIPETDTPGALGAGVPQYIDLAVSEEQKLRKVFTDGLPKLEKKSKTKFGSTFLEATKEQQIELLEALSITAEREKTRKPEKRSKDTQFFDAIKSLTADGYYTSKVGLIEELGYDGNAALASFPAASIPEH
jgi:hypothetical protein